MKNQTDELRSNLGAIIQQGTSVEACLILREMLDRAELTCRIVNEDGKQICAWSSRASDRTLDRIAGITSEDQRPVFELFVNGMVEFMAGDLGNGLDIYWRLRKEDLEHTTRLT